MDNDGTMDNATGSTGMTTSQKLTKGFLTFEVDYFIKNGQDPHRPLEEGRAC